MVIHKVGVVVTILSMAIAGGAEVESFNFVLVEAVDASEIESLEKRCGFTSMTGTVNHHPAALHKIVKSDVFVEIQLAVSVLVQLLEASLHDLRVVVERPAHTLLEFLYAYCPTTV